MKNLSQEQKLDCAEIIADSVESILKNARKPSTSEKKVAASLWCASRLSEILSALMKDSVVSQKVTSEIVIDDYIRHNVLSDYANTTKTIADIARKYDISYAKCTNIVKSSTTIPTGRESKRLTSQQKIEIITDITENVMSNAEICNKYSVSDSTISYYRKQIKTSGV
jgi:hypothetical protein